MKLTSYSDFTPCSLLLADIALNRGELWARVAPIDEGIVAPMRRAQ